MNDLDKCLNHFPLISIVQDYFVEQYPFMRSLIPRNFDAFGNKWAKELENLLERMFNKDQKKIFEAIDGYATFAMDALRLQKRFERERKYIHKTYREVSKAVYHNKSYMESLYLPGILLSHYFWPHHYRQKEFCEISFIRDIQRAADKTFWDVGIGTGFYSRLALQMVPEARGTGFDISQYSKNFSERQIRAFDCDSRYSISLRDIVEDTPHDQVPFLMSVEVLEHLENPEIFLQALRRMLKPGGKAFITAAINAPNEDHIYLYNNSEEVLDQLRAVGFKLEQFMVAAGYPPKDQEPVPLIAAYIVT